VILSIGEWLSGDAQTYFQVGMVLVACALIVQMVFWMRQHGRTLKKEMESSMADYATKANWWGVLVLSAIAIAREGSETVVFLYGVGASAQVSTFVLMAGLGFGLALITFYLLQLGGKYISWRYFFKITEILLLCLGSALLVNGVENLVSLGVLPGLVDPVWDSSWLLDDMSRFGGVMASFFGYRAQPALMTVLVYLAYWGLLFLRLRVHRPVEKALKV
jgi:high-affinity iron transporter